MILWNQEATFKRHWIASFYPFEWHSNVCHLIDLFESHAKSCKRIKTTWRKKKRSHEFEKPCKRQIVTDSKARNASQINSFLKKTTNKIFMYLLAPSFCKILKNSYSRSIVMRIWHFQNQNGPFVLNKIILIQTIITFICLLALFIVQNFKNFLQQIQGYEDPSFLGPKWSICPNFFFFWKLLKSLSSTY